MEVFIVAGARTPIGSFRKALANCTAPYLGSVAIRAAVQRAGAQPGSITEVYMGQVCQAGSGQAPARQAAIFAGLSPATPCSTIHKVCASGMKAAMLASQSLALGHNHLMVAGGMESMSRVPFYLPRADAGYGGVTLADGIVSDGLTDVYNNIHMGACTERLVKRLGISREDQDAYARSSYSRSQAAAAAGRFKDELVPVTVKQRKSELTVEADEEYQRVDFDRFSSLRPAFQPDGSITAANASTLNDGAAAMVLANSRGLAELDEAAPAVPRRPLARVVGFADAATEPADFGIAPVLAVNKLLGQHSLTVGDISLWEINEAFSAVALACARQLGISDDRLNLNGGAVSIGHPIGMSGARITLHLALQLRPGQLGVAAICNGGGGASAILLQGV